MKGFVQLRNRDGRSDTMRGLGTYLNNFGQTAALLWPIHTIKVYILSSKWPLLVCQKCQNNGAGNSPKNLFPGSPKNFRKFLEIDLDLPRSPKKPAKVFRQSRVSK